MRLLKGILFLTAVVFAGVAHHVNANVGEHIRVGAEQSELYLPHLQGKRVGIIVNQTSRVGTQHLADFLLDNKVNVTAIFAPEHGFKGEQAEGDTVASSRYERGNIPIHSIYGPQKAPDQATMNSIDVMLFDIQDVGVRYYTYLSSMHYMMEGAAKQGIPFIVLDRPNPNGAYIDGPVLKIAFRSFVGMHPIPLLHGMTLGELAQMIVGEKWLETPLELKVIPVANYHKQPYSLPIKPSPNLPNDQAIALYPSLGFFEATPISIGRGTEFPFQVIGYDQVHLGSFEFMPSGERSKTISTKLAGKRVLGMDLRSAQTEGLTLKYLLAWARLFKAKDMAFFDRPEFMDKLAGTDELRKGIEAGMTETQLRQSWQADLNEFKTKRKPYLLYESNTKTQPLQN